eukprot:1638983-Alexandrium_andersonii.AAC.1
MVSEHSDAGRAHGVAWRKPLQAPARARGTIKKNVSQGVCTGTPTCLGMPPELAGPPPIVHVGVAAPQTPAAGRGLESPA